jgi:hypothetical protein
MKKTLITVLLVLVVCAVTLSVVRGWLTLSTHGPDPGSNKANLNLTVDPDKMNEDAKAVQNKTAELIGKVAEDAKEPGDLTSDKVKSTDP